MLELNIEQRLNICKKCPIYEPKKQICNSKLWINPDTDEVSTYAKVGFIRGCHCVMTMKARNPHNHCIAGKW